VNRCLRTATAEAIELDVPGATRLYSVGGARRGPAGKIFSVQIRCAGERTAHGPILTLESSFARLVPGKLAAHRSATLNATVGPFSDDYHGLQPMDR
jgi:hypothetical protein